MAVKNTSIILCTGAWHTEFHAQPAVLALQKSGYRVISRPLVSAGNKAGRQEDIEAIEAAISSELQDGHEVCLIVHSAAGTPGCEAVNRILDRGGSGADRIVRIIFVAAVLQNDEVVEHLKREGNIRLDLEQGVAYPEKAEKGLFNDMTSEAAQPFIEALTWQALYPQTPLSSTSWRKVALSYLICLQDNAVPLKIQETVGSEYGMQVVRLDAGHEPFISQPEKFVEVVDGMLRS
ncbi:hypothetical protein LTR37_007122 [Vermiconidia calcicola]|uniref:Uncharacterized protein n=1 Tax=Vermiconidia calcicola TaxID=1690605 RepID=A0ACC3NE68_9PEZI|nr:hypothetical protein LTR37_007122 [Vermiconidia calcicola]